MNLEKAKNDHFRTGKSSINCSKKSDKPKSRVNSKDQRRSSYVNSFTNYSNYESSISISQSHAVKEKRINCRVLRIFQNSPLAMPTIRLILTIFELAKVSFWIKKLAIKNFIERKDALGIPV